MEELNSRGRGTERGFLFRFIELKMKGRHSEEHME
jgi:hypothetical protein